MVIVEGTRMYPLLHNIYIGGEWFVIVTYDKLIEMEIKKILLMIDKGEKYKAYRYS